jgi:D-tagatose-1,6-bisphosphate aldolase subunit GatZ/KbaZ
LFIYLFDDCPPPCWPSFPAADDPATDDPADRLLNNLSAAPIPLPLLSQYLPEQFRELRGSRIPNDPREFIEHKIAGILDDYSYACDPL